MITKRVRAADLKPGQFLIQGPNRPGERTVQRILEVNDTTVPAREGAKKQVPARKFVLSNGLGQDPNTIIYKPSAIVRTRG